ncbi:MAG: DUF445 family protein [Bdellovibrionales bacterium]|nr:DUF445 family protein [Bdellovibrionales bacterium]
MEIRYFTYAIMPVVAAAIGWLTNYLAVKMLFRPYKPVRVLGFTFVGVIPRRQADLADRIGQTVEEELISHEDVQKVITSPEVTEEIVAMIEEHVDNFLRGTFGRLPLGSTFLSGDIAQTVKAGHIEYLRRAIPELMDSAMTRVEAKIDFREIVRKKIEQFDLHRLEEIVYQIASHELRAIEVFGGIVGFIVGLAQVGLLVLSENMF